MTLKLVSNSLREVKFILRRMEVALTRNLYLVLTGWEAKSVEASTAEQVAQLEQTFVIFVVWNVDVA